jgi:hypothetical protein
MFIKESGFDHSWPSKLKFTTSTFRAISAGPSSIEAERWVEVTRVPGRDVHIARSD